MLERDKAIDNTLVDCARGYLRDTAFLVADVGEDDPPFSYATTGPAASIASMKIKMLAFKCPVIRRSHPPGCFVKVR